MMRAKRVIEGLTVVSVGCILLANMLGVLPWRVWMGVLSLWPLLIVALGLDIIGKGLDRGWACAASSLVILCGLLYAVGSAATNGGVGLMAATSVGSGERQAFEFTEPASNAFDRGVARIRGGAGTVTIRGSSALARAKGMSPYEPEFSVRRDGSVARVDVSLGSHPWLWGGRTKAAELDVGLSTGLPWDLTVEAGAAELVADLSDITIARLRIDTGVSDSAVTFGAPDGVVPVELGTGVSAVTLRFPRDCSYKITVTGALASLEGDGANVQGGKGSAKTVVHGPADAEDRYEVSIEAGVSSIRVELY